MSNAIDYVSWRGDLSFSSDGFNEVDMLIFSELVYAPLENHSNPFQTSVCNGPTLVSLFKTVYPKPLPKKTSYVFRPRYDLWCMMQNYRRFAEVRLDRFISNFEPENDKQFAAAVFCCDINCKKIAVVSFRGTDSTVTGWKEDFDMAYKSPIPAQSDSVGFLNSVLKTGYDEIYVCGHSKGGNLAMYSSALCASPQAIKAVYNFDGPGLQKSMISSETWEKVKPKIHSFIPESSVIGLLLVQGTAPVVIESDSKGIMQHNPFYWHVCGTHFVETEDTTFSSRFLDETLHDFMETCTLEQKELLVRTTFEIIEVSGAVRVRDIAKGLMLNLPQVRKKISSIPESDRKVLADALRIMAGSGSRTMKLLFGKD